MQNISKRILELILCFVFLSGLSSQLAAENIKWGTFALYEHASKKVILDGVSTRYGIGAAGIEAQITSTDKTKSISIKYGLGYHPAYSITSSGTEFTGPVEGQLFEAAIQSKILSSLFDETQLQLKYNNRHVYSNNLSGVRGGINYISTTDAKMQGYELTISKGFSISDTTLVTPFIGINSWNLQADGNAYSSNLAIKKKVKGSNVDPLMGFKLQTQILQKDINLGLTYRPIKADNLVETLEFYTALYF